jgi:hypothetical protein
MVISECQLFSAGMRCFVKTPEMRMFLVLDSSRRIGLVTRLCLGKLSELLPSGAEKV